MVLATQNPVEQEGTYPLPEAQLDRFLMQVNIDYPSAEEELRIVELLRAEERGAAVSTQAGETPARIPQQAIFDARAEISAMHVAPALGRYITDLVCSTRQPARLCQELARWIEVGASPRGSLALDRCARARAWLAGRDYVDPEDVRAVARDCLRHRLILSYEAQGEGIGPEPVIDRLIERVALP